MARRPQMWYMLAPASWASRSITSAIVVRRSTVRAASAASAKTPSASRAEGSVEQLDDLEHGHRSRARGRSCSRP